MQNTLLLRAIPGLKEFSKALLGNEFISDCFVLCLP